MATKFTDVYSSAVFKFRDYDLMEYIPDLREAILSKHLLAAISDFSYSCLEDLTYDIDTEEFNEDLSSEVIEILGEGVLFHWLSAKVMDSDALKNIISNKDFNTYSPANLLKETKALRKEVRKEYKDRIATYSFRHGNLSDLKAGG